MQQTAIQAPAPTKRDLLITYAKLADDVRTTTSQAVLKSSMVAMSDVLGELAKHGVTPDDLSDARKGLV